MTPFTTLQLWLMFLGGSLYLSNKIYLDAMERSAGSNEERYWRYKKLAWAVYLLGLPPIVLALLLRHNVLFACIEIGGIPSMLCGLVLAFKRKDAPPWLERMAVLAIPPGLIWSAIELHGFEHVSQYLELLASAGFLIGTYKVYKRRLAGYRWFALMNVSAGLLFLLQHYPWWLTAMQGVSIIFVVDTYYIKKARRMNAVA